MGYQIKSATLQNYGQLRSFSCNRFSNINLIIGENASGKTFLLKALYSAVRTLEDYQRGDDIRPVNDILAEKLRWTFQVEKLGDMVTKSSQDGLLFSMHTSDQPNFSYRFSDSAVSKIVSVSSHAHQKAGNSVFIPAKEVLSLYSLILKSRDIDRVFGFDDTYYDLIKLLSVAPSRGKNFRSFADAREKVNAVIDGKIDFDNSTNRWYYKNNKNQKFSIGATSEGVKKLAIMDRLLANGQLNKDSVIFIDELESALHPKAICDYLDMLAAISQEMGIQIFISSHSYFVIKKLYLIALQHPNTVICISLNKEDAPTITDLSNGMPETSIIQTSVDLYEQEINEIL